MIAKLQRSVAVFAVVFFAALPAAAHLGHGNPLPWRACDGKALSTPCAWEHDDTVYRGTCQDMGGPLLCVRNQPLQAKAPATFVTHSMASDGTQGRVPVPLAILGALAILAIGAAVHELRLRSRPPPTA